MNKQFAEKFVLKFGHLLENVSFPVSIESEVDLEYAILPHIQNFVKKEISQNLDGVLYYHGRTKEEKKWWTKSKLLQTVKLFGTNVSDLFLIHPKIGAVAVEFKYAKLDRTGQGLTGHIQRAIGQSLIATLRHPFAVCVIIHRRAKKHLESGMTRKLKDLLWSKHRIYLIIRKQ